MVTSNFVIFPYRKRDYVDGLIGYVNMLQERSSVCSISCTFHNIDVISLSVLETYMGHFINNAQGGKTAEWMMQSQ
jgi:hypothetical protein